MLGHMDGSPTKPDSAAGTQQINVIIVDDEVFVRRALSMYLESDETINVVGEAEDGNQAVTLTRELKPHVVMMDLQMPNTDGVEATRRIVEEGLPSKILVITGHVANTFVIDSLAAGASGYVVKDAEPEHIVNAVKGVAAGDRPIDPTVTRHLIDHLRLNSSASNTLFESESMSITEREREVLDRLCQGKSNREIAADMYISETTVKYHLVRLMQKFEVRGRVELVVSALRRGIVN